MVFVCLLLISTIIFTYHLSSFEGYYVRSSFPIRLQHIKAGIYDWVKAQGVKDDDIKVVFDSTAVVAKNRIQKGDLLVSVPLDLCIDIGKANKRFGALFNGAKLRTGKLGLLALYLLSEKSAGQSSNYAKYIATLSSTATGILSWNEEEIEELVSSTTRKISTQFDAIKRDVEYIQSLNSPLLAPAIFSYDQFRWALSVVKAKYVVLDQNPVLVPG